ncbi:MAG: ABC transporter substrate-binding protein [Alphaproteobacteria bacterium]
MRDVGDQKSDVSGLWSVVGKAGLVLTLCTTLFVLNTSALAQQVKYRIGVLYPGGPLSQTVDGLRAGLREVGIEDGKQVVFLVVDTKGDTKVAEEAAKNFEREKVNLVYAVGSTVIVAAKQATASVPIVFSVGSDPVALGIVKDFVKPGGRLTGVHYLVMDLTAKRLELLKEILPKLGRVLTFYDPGNKVAVEAAGMARGEAKRLGLKFIERQVRSADDLRAGLQSLKTGEAEAFFYLPDTMIVSQSQSIIETARAKRLATMFQDESVVAKGALASYGQNYYEIGRLSAKHVQRVLSGTPPGELRVETVDNVDLVINLLTAKQLGLTIPAQVLARANKVIK